MQQVKTSLQEQIQIHATGINIGKSKIVLKDKESRIQLATTDWTPKIQQNVNYLPSMKINYYFNQKQIIILEVYKQNRNQPSGTTEFSLTDLVTADNKELTIQVRSLRCRIVLSFEFNSRSEDIISLRFSANLPMSCMCLAPTSCLQILTPKEGGDDQVVAGTETVNNANAKYPEIRVKISDLCNNDYQRPLKGEIIQRGWFSNYSFGQFDFNLTSILEEGQSKFELSTPQKQYVILDNVEIEHIPHMIDFLQSGLEICFMAAVDFTASNLNPNKPNSLHYINRNNPQSSSLYEQSLMSIGEILLEYDEDKKVPLWGFGAQVNGRVSHCFPLNGNNYDPEVTGLKEIRRYYRNAVENVRFAGPTLMEPLLKNASNFIQEDIAQSNNLKYYILLILTDGDIHDMKKTIDSVVDASYNLPLSIVIMGIGRGPFTKMDQLDADDEPLIDKNGRKYASDIVQFVEYQKFKNNISMLTGQVLEEIPRQLKDYFKRKGIYPKDCAKSRRQQQQKLFENQKNPLSDILKTNPNSTNMTMQSSMSTINYFNEQ